MSLPLKWEFPGGKLEPGELPEECIVRELMEELEIEVDLLGRGPAIRYPIGPDPIIELLPFVCKIKAGTLRLVEHHDSRWGTVAEIRDLDWAPADIAVLDWWHKNKGEYIRFTGF